MWLVVLNAGKRPRVKSSLDSTCVLVTDKAVLIYTTCLRYPKRATSFRLSYSLVRENGTQAAYVTSMTSTLLHERAFDRNACFTMAVNLLFPLQVHKQLSRKYTRLHKLANDLQV